MTCAAGYFSTANAGHTQMRHCVIASMLGANFLRSRAAHRAEKPHPLYRPTLRYCIIVARHGERCSVPPRAAAKALGARPNTYITTSSLECILTDMRMPEPLSGKQTKHAGTHRIKPLLDAAPLPTDVSERGSAAAGALRQWPSGRDISGDSW